MRRLAFFAAALMAASSPLAAQTVAITNGTLGRGRWVGADPGRYGGGA